MKTDFRTNIYIVLLWRLAVAFVLLWLGRWAFAWYNADQCAISGMAEVWPLAIGGIRFDLSALAYFNSLVILLSILPLRIVYTRWYGRMCLWIYAVCNSIMLAVNIADIPYFRFTGARLRWSNIVTVTTDSELWRIMLSYAGTYRWVFVAFVVMVVLLVWLATRAKPRAPSGGTLLWVRCVLFFVFAALTFAAMRGRLGDNVPLSIPDAAFSARKTPQINVVLNSPFCVLRSMNRSKSNIEPRITFFSDDSLAAIRNSLHPGADSLLRRNIITIVLESGGAVWLDSIATRLGMSPPGLMPFLDSIAGRSRVFVHTIACSRSSVGGFTAISCGFPDFDPFFYMLSPYNSNKLDSPARLLADKGWATAFYYGCRPGSFNIDQTAFTSGYNHIVDRSTYGNDADFDGAWGIFDYPMAEYAVADMSTLSQPFAAAWFTISAHEPFSIPDGWPTDSFKHPERSPQRGLEYTDRALRHFFELASQQTWYENTTFIITADHGNREFKGTVYDTPYIHNHIPFIVYTPDGSIEPGIDGQRVFSQHDIAATTLGLAGYDSSFVQLGVDAFNLAQETYGIHRTADRYLVVGPRYAIYTTPAVDAIEEVFDISADPAMAAPITACDEAETAAMLRWTQAFLQDYTHRLLDNRLSL